MRQFLSGFLLLMMMFLSSGSAHREAAVTHYNIPVHQLNLYQAMGITTESASMEVGGFMISRQVTLGEYKGYLSAVQRDSTSEFYLSQIPGDEMLDKSIWQVYLENPIYEAYPVVGVSWEQARNFCLWKSQKKRTDGATKVYRLPHHSEWLAAYLFLSGNRIGHDFNQHYSDWLINTKTEMPSRLTADDEGRWPFDRLYDHKKDDPRILKRKSIIGNSFHYQTEHLRESMLYGYADQGYRYVGFRYVTEKQ